MKTNGEIRRLEEIPTPREEKRDTGLRGIKYPDERTRKISSTLA